MAAFFTDLGKVFNVAIRAVRLIFFGGKFDACELGAAARAQKAFLVIRYASKRNPTLEENLRHERTSAPMSQ